LRFSQSSLVERRDGDLVICDLCVADLYRQCVENLGPDWPDVDEGVSKPS